MAVASMIADAIAIGPAYFFPKFATLLSISLPVAWESILIALVYWLDPGWVSTLNPSPAAADFGTPPAASAMSPHLTVDESPRTLIGSIP